MMGREVWSDTRTMSDAGKVSRKNTGTMSDARNVNFTETVITLQLQQFTEKIFKN